MGRDWKEREMKGRLGEDIVSLGLERTTSSEKSKACKILV